MDRVRNEVVRQRLGGGIELASRLDMWREWKIIVC